jgi:hypothetical protein
MQRRQKLGLPPGDTDPFFDDMDENTVENAQVGLPLERISSKLVCMYENRAQSCLNFRAKLCL